jgi:AcrR family transcriptional regulator
MAEGLPALLGERALDPMPSGDKAERGRDLIRRSLVELIDEQGYARTTLEDVLRKARIDRGEFELSYETLDECFAEVWREYAQALAGPVLEVYAEAGNWRDGIRAQAWTLCRMTIEDELRARICMVEVNFGGDVVQATRDIVMAGYVELVHLGRHETERGADVPKAQAEAVVGAIYERVGRHITAGSLDSLVDDIPGLLYLAYLPYLGPETAQEELRRGARDIERFRRGEI